MSQSIDTNKPSVLFVDDEVNILRSIRRTLRNLDIELLLAETPEKALTIISKTKVDVIVSDMKMPNMTGAQLLEKAAEQQPNSFRIILSGYADVESMLAAINKGKVHRYLNKPWSNEALVEVIEDGIELSQLRRENSRLLELTQLQNQELEKKVSLRTRQIRAAFARIKEHSYGLERVLYNVIVSHPNINGKFARQVSESAKQLAETLNLTEKEQMVVRLAGLICEIGLVGLSQELIEKNFTSLNYEQQKAYMNQANIAQIILAPLQGLEEEIEIIACQFMPVNKAPEPSKGARIISICRDYWRYRMGRILKHKLTPSNTRIEMLKHAGTRYDKEILKTFLEVDKNSIDDIVVGTIDSSGLVPGMTLKQDLYNDSHILILPKNHVFTDRSIAKLQQFERGNLTKMHLDIDSTNKKSVSEA